MKTILVRNKVRIFNNCVDIPNTSPAVSVDLASCAKNYNFGEKAVGAKCVAIRNAEEMSFTFFTQPKIKLLFKNQKPVSLFSDYIAMKKFYRLQKEIEMLGYTTYDQS